ncbi:MAG TPA: DUF6326 family protein [Fibrobacteria bacterium]|nr:DUF6326 family protein [Fibrobacteria bacterium]HOX50000.1 DUF6326 family protein [Fibrobacteria bacterium]
MNPDFRTFDRTSLLSTMWIFLAANWLCCDILSLMDPRMIRMLVDGGPASLRIDQKFLLLSGLVLEIPIAMIVLSRLLPLRPRRCTSLLAALAMIAIQVGSFGMGEPSTLHYVFFSVVQIVGALVVAIAAATWRIGEPTPTPQAPSWAGKAIPFPKFMAAIVVPFLVAASDSRSSDTLGIPSGGATSDTLRRTCTRVFLSTPFSLKESHSVAAIGLGWSGTKWATRFDVGLMEDGLDSHGPINLDLTGGWFWKHDLASPIAIYEGITITDQTGIHESFEGHAVSMVFLAGCEFRPDRGEYAFHVEAGTGGAFTHRTGAYQGGTVLSAGLRHYIGK